MTGLIAWSEREGGRVTSTFVGGAGVVYRHTVRQTTVSSRSLNDLAFGLTGGVDATISVSQRVFVAPTFRLHWLADRDRTESSLPKRGVGSFITRLGVGLGVGF
jgi:hypothetical protein